MDQVEWKGWDNWEKSHAIRYEKEITEFREWLRRSVAYIKTQDVYEALINYYFNAVSLTPGSTYQKRVEQGREALSALYNYERLNNG